MLFILDSYCDYLYILLFNQNLSIELSRVISNFLEKYQNKLNSLERILELG